LASATAAGPSLWSSLWPSIKSKSHDTGDLTFTDLFAGAGGSSTGAQQVAGVHCRIAANHNKIAVAVHNANHPHADHAAVDLHEENPAFFPKTDILWASPECTKWSQSNSMPLPAIEEGLFEDPNSSDAANRSRLLMFDVLRFAEYHRYRVMIVENVVDIACRVKYRTAWTEWRRQLRNLGYRFRVVSLNSMHAQTYGAPAPQSRDRIYIVCWLEGDREPDMERILRPRAYCSRCDLMVEARQSWKNGNTVGKYRQQYLYVHGDCGTVVEPGWLPASAAIDWTIPGQLIGDRLSPKTRARIAAGIARYWSPLAVPVEGRDGKEAQPLDIPGRTQTTRAETALAMLPFMLDRRGEYRTRDLNDPLSTLTANDTTKSLVSRGQDLLPFIAELRGGGSDARSVREAAATFCASGNHHALITPAGGTWNDEARTVADYLPTLTTRDAYALIAPYYSGTEYAQPTSDPMGTLTTHDRNALVMRNNTGGAEMMTPVTEYLRTLTTAGHQSLVHGPVRGGKPQATAADLAAAEQMVPECYARMFQPHETAAGMAFPSDYDWSVADEKGRLPSKRDVVRMTGNAVTPPVSRDIMHVVVDTLAGAA
jgi:DNA (cytosine-5)-methyltransferase 1